MICRHCKKTIHPVEAHPNGEVWGDGKYIVCDIKNRLQFHEPDIPIDDIITGLQRIEADLR